MTETVRFTVTSSATVTMIFLVASLVFSCSYDVYGEPNTEVESIGTPDLETFATYDEMRRYFANRNLRSLRYMENPDDDSYIDAFNKHNEQPAELDIDKLRALQKRPKRAAEEHQLPNEPKLLKFEISDAVEPTDEVKEIVRRHRSREMANKTNISTENSTVKPDVNARKVRARKVQKSNTKRAGRTKRASNLQQPRNFQVKFIPFQIEDAREPDEVTKKLIRHMRAMELERLNAENKNFPAKGLNQRPIKLKRTRRNAPKTIPEMFKFEIEDAKEPDESMKKLLKLSENRESKELKETKKTFSTTENKASLNGTKASAVDQNTSVDNENDDDDEDEDEDDDDEDDQQSHESRRFYTYKEAPGLKTRKSLNSLPQEVQKVITHLLTEQQGGKAYLKYIPTEQMDYRHLKSNYYVQKLQQPVYGTKLKPSTNYAKYVLPLAVQKVEPVQVHAVPVVEKIRFVYPQNKYAQLTQIQQPIQQQPIVVAEAPRSAEVQQAYAEAVSPRPAEVHHTYAAAVSPRPAEVHHTYAADLSHVHSEEPIQVSLPQAIKDVPAPQFRPSKPDPLLEDNKLTEDYIQYTPVTPVPMDHLKYELFPYGTAPQSYYHSYAKPHIQLLSQQHPELHKMATTAPAPVIKIEYHASADALKDNYKELQEFKELSTLMGKSPEDQMHGLTYLLAKEMQNKIQRQSQNLANEEERPQDSTSPILFHPKDAKILKEHKMSTSHIPGRLMGLGKTKEYIPIVESASSVEQTRSNSQSEPAKAATEEISNEASSHEYLEYGGLSPNYEVVHSAKTTLVEPKLVVEQFIHHPSAINHGNSHEKLVAPFEHHSAEVKLGAGLKLAGNNVHFGVHHDDHQALQYASKYAFGYRIRDFHTGNDFGHKQNRDLDGVTRGQYHILLPDGRIQNVIYHADDTGFHADVSFESGH